MLIICTSLPNYLTNCTHKLKPEEACLNRKKYRLIREVCPRSYMHMVKIALKLCGTLRIVTT